MTETIPLPAFHVMVKPRGAVCNLACRYCFYLKKEQLYPDGSFRMSEALLEDYVRQYIAAQQVPEVTFAWQGGEPTLMGLDFYRKAVELQARYRRPGMRVLNAFQTNGILLDADWCRFFHEHNFLVGLSIDGPRALHDTFRLDQGDQPTFARVLRAAELLQAHQVEYNTLTCVSAANAPHGLEVYAFLRDTVHSRYMQFIPIIERENSTGFQEGARLTRRSISGSQYGRFLIDVFDEWVRRDVGRVSVQMFDSALAAWSGQRPGLCVYEETCGQALAMEFNGDLYACDHFVEPRYFLGNLNDTPVADLAGSAKQREFGLAKRDRLPRFCRECPVRFACNGGCPKDRVLSTPDGEAGLNALCAGFRSFYTYIDRPMKIMAALLRSSGRSGSGRSGNNPADITRILANDPPLRELPGDALCPCGSGRPVENCHRAQASPLAPSRRRH